MLYSTVFPVTITITAIITIIDVGGDTSHTHELEAILFQIYDTWIST
jgi:hypothetical protein